jgi:hypothetical protein
MYIHLKPEGELPKLPDLGEFKVAIVLREPVSRNWQFDVSKWLVGCGCKYGCSWGVNCSDWDDSIDYAAIDASGSGIIGNDELIMTTWHENESMSEFFDFVKRFAVHPNFNLGCLLILEISNSPNRINVMKTYERARDQL